MTADKAFKLKMCMPTHNGIVEKLIDELVQAIDLIEKIDDTVYTQSANGTGSVGGHFRHNFDFVLSLLNGISEGKVDYEKRERDPRIETDRQYAIDRYIVLVRRLVKILPDELCKELLVRSEIDNTTWHRSSVSREIEFVLSHTVHHHAFIVEKLAIFEVKTTANFAGAPSTLRYWQQSALTKI